MSKYYVPLSTKEVHARAVPADIAPKPIHNSVAVIGSGVAGLGAVLGLVAEFEKSPTIQQFSISSQFSYNPISVHIFEKESHFGQGFPYSRDQMEPEHLVNMPLDGMSLYPGDFAIWLQQNEGRIKKEILSLFNLRFKKEFHRIFNENFDEACFSTYAERFGKDFIALHKKYDDLGQAYALRYLNRSDPQFYPPRIVYGLYLEDNFTDAINRLRQLGIRVVLHPNTEVIDISPNKTNHVVHYQNANNEKGFISVHSAIIATGHWQNKGLHTADNYLSTTWPAKECRKRLDKVIQHAATKAYAVSDGSPVTVRIAVQGSSLSAIDALRIIFQNGAYARNAAGQLVFTPPLYRFKDPDGNEITARIEADILSRNGILPKVRGLYGKYVNQHLNEKNVQACIAGNGGYITLAQVMHLLKNDLECAYAEAGVTSNIDWEKLLSPNKRGFEQLRKDLKKSVQGDAANGTLIWQTVYHQASDLFLYIHKHLIAEDKLRYEAFLRTVHFMHIAPMSQYTAEELIAMQEAGVLHSKTLGSAPKHRIRHRDANLEFTDHEGRKHTYDATIVATGQDMQIHHNSTHLFRNLLQRGMATTSQNVIPDNFTLTSPLRSSAVSDHRMLQIYTQKTTNGRIFDSGAVRRSTNMELIDHHNRAQNGLYIVGVASSAFGVSRASRSVEEGRVIGRAIAQNIIALGEEYATKWTYRCSIPQPLISRL
jgi:uncharacterized NAD(P)/FAD-binding protein YdhS